MNKTNEITIHSSAAEYLTYIAATGDDAESFEMRYEDENIWLTQRMMAEPYDVSKQTISQHIQRIYDDGELILEATAKKYLTVQTEGQRQVSRNLEHYNLQMIIAVGFKVNNQRAVQFRKWAGQIVKDYTIQGWTMDKERLKKGHMFTDEYFDRQLQHIREIRASERKFYQEEMVKSMKQRIISELRKVEERENVTILLAVESGSRAWGFASPDSDYDVRFIYKRPLEEYLRLEKRRDVIELPIDDVLDINGWDLSKTLQLLHNSNPTLFEWFSSPIRYIDTDFHQRIDGFKEQYFLSKSGIYHYLSMAKGNFREYLKGDMVKAKKYFYVVRPILACRWILEKGTPPPMLFAELADSQLSADMKPIIDDLLDIKMNSPEIKEIPRIDALNTYIENSISEIEAAVAALPHEDKAGWDGLNGFFRREVMTLQQLMK